MNEKTSQEGLKYTRFLLKTIGIISILIGAISSLIAPLEF